jgi:hypothetical protein
MSDARETVPCTHDMVFLRTAALDGGSHNGFLWPREIGALVEAPDWDPAPKCGGGLHGIADGLGDWALMQGPADTDALWYVCGARRAEAVEIDGKVKVPRCVVLYVGAFAGAMEMIAPFMSRAMLALVERRHADATPEGPRATGESGAASATGWSGAASATGWSGAASVTGVRGAASATGGSGAASATGGRGAASATGESGAASATGWSGAASVTGARGAASATGQDGVALAAGWHSRGMVGESCLLVLVERNGDGRIVHHFAALAGTCGIEAGRWYELREGVPVDVTGQQS